MSKELLGDIDGKWIHEGDVIRFRDLAGNIQKFKVDWDKNEKKIVMNELVED